MVSYAASQHIEARSLAEEAFYIGVEPHSKVDHGIPRQQLLLQQQQQP
jgi:hypothetical protein